VLLRTYQAPLCYTVYARNVQVHARHQYRDRCASAASVLCNSVIKALISIWIARSTMKDIPVNINVAVLCWVERNVQRHLLTTRKDAAERLHP
jgi:hypothetical protein